MKKQLFFTAATLVIPTTMSLVLIWLFGERSMPALQTATVNAPHTRGLQRPENPVTNGYVPYHLDGFDDPNHSRNNFIAGRGVWCCDGDSTCSPSVCRDDDILSTSFDPMTRLGDSGRSLKLDYDVEQVNSLASYHQALSSGDTFYDLSSFDEFRIWVKGEGATVGERTTFYIRFADRSWHVAYVQIVGLSDHWEKKVVDLRSLNALDWTHMRELTLVFEQNRERSGKIAHPLSGTLYVDDLTFWDRDVQVDGTHQFLDLLEKRAFQYFWEYADPATGLIRDRATDADLSSIAAVGFGLSAICVAEERDRIA